MKKAVLFALLCCGAVFAQTGKGSVSGALRAIDGTPAVGVRVSASPLDNPAAAGASEITSLAQTDAAGNFRIENLPPGRYRIFAGMVTAPTYFPGVTEAGAASAVTVVGDGAVASIDFRMVLPASLKVSGRVVLPRLSTPGPAVAMVTLLPRTPSLPIRPLNATVRPDGTFEIANVAPGTYNVRAVATDGMQKEPKVITVETSDITDLQLEILSAVTPTEVKGLEQVWSIEGSWGGATSDSAAAVIHATKQGRIFDIDASGKVISDRAFPAQVVLRPARFDGKTAFLGFSTWSPAVTALDNAGAQLWSYPPATGGSSGIDDAVAEDLDGDGNDEVIVGFNGPTGVHVLNSKGEVVWKYTSIGNVWHVAAGDVRGNGKAQVVTTSAAGQIHIFSGEGQGPVNIAPGLYANMVRVGKVSPTDPAATIFVLGSVGPAREMRAGAFSSDGTARWAANLPVNGDPSTNSTVIAPGRPWLAVATQASGQIFVLDATNGAILASADGQGTSPQLAWLTDKDSGAPLLVVSSRAGLRAYRLK